MVTKAQQDRETAELARKLCGACVYYGNHANWSSRCNHPAGAPSWTYRGDRGVRRDNSCPRWVSVFEAAVTPRAA